MTRLNNPLTRLTPLVWVTLGLLPFALGGWAQSQLAQFVTYGIFALALGFLWGHVGVLSFGQAIFFGLGAYSMGLTSLHMVPGIAPTAFNGFVLALTVSGIAAAVLGAVLFYGRGLAGAYFAIATLCAAVIVEMVTGRWDYVGGNNGLFGIPSLELPPIIASHMSATASQYLLALSVALIIYALLRWLTRTPFGIVLAAIRDNERRAAFLGYNVALHKNMAFVLSAMVSALAGALFATFFGFVSPTLIGFSLSTEVLIWVAVGGRSVLMAAFLGAVLVRTVESALSERFGDYWLLVLGGVFVVVVVFFPLGVFGRLFKLAVPRRLRVNFAEAAVERAGQDMQECAGSKPTPN